MLAHCGGYPPPDLEKKLNFFKPYMNYWSMNKAEIIINLHITNYIQFVSCFQLCNIKYFIKHKNTNWYSILVEFPCNIKTRVFSSMPFICYPAYLNLAKLCLCLVFSYPPPDQMAACTRWHWKAVPPTIVGKLLLTQNSFLAG